MEPVSNQELALEYLQTTEVYKIYKNTYDITESEQIDVDEAMRESDQDNHFFAVKYPPIDKAFIVFRDILPIFDPVYLAIKMNTPKSKEKLLSMLPPYQLLMLDDSVEPPTDEKLAEQLSEFLSLWIEINVIEEKGYSEFVNNYDRN